MYIIIAGAGMLGRRLAQHLIKSRHDVVVVDRDKASCEEVFAKIGATAVHGDATEIETLEEAGIDRADVVVALMKHDAANLACALLAKHFEVKRTIVRGRNNKYETAYKMAGVTTVVSAVDVLLDQLIIDIEQPEFTRAAVLGGGKASLVVVTVSPGSVGDGRTVAELTGQAEFPSDCVVAGIVRGEGGEFVIPRGAVQIRGGDRVFLAASSSAVRKAASFFGVKT